MTITVRRRLDVRPRLSREVAVKVGYPEETTGRDEYADGLNLATNALIQTLGNPGNRLFSGPIAPIPPRDFMGQGAADWRSDWIRRGAARAFVEAFEANDPERFGEAIGLSLKGFIQEAFTSGSWEANSDFTVQRKNSSQPLIDDGKLRQGVDYIVEVR